MVMITKDSHRIATNKLPFFVQLMPHQKAMIYEMILVENKLHDNPEHKYAMMSDKPGAGKTFAVLGFIYFLDKVVLGKKGQRVNLIVVPYNICSQWKQSMERIFGPSGNVMKYKVLIDYSDVMRLYVEPSELMGYDIILTTSLYFDNLATTINSLKMKLKRVFFDEADSIKNLLKTPLNCQITWFVSASMESLFGKGSSVSIGNYNLSMNHLKTHDVKCDPEFVNENIILESPLIHKIMFRNIYYNLLKDIVPGQHHNNISAMDYRCLRSEFVRDIDNINSEYIACLYVMKDCLAKKDHYSSQIELLKRDYELLIKRELFKKADEVKKDIEHYERIIQDCDRKLSCITFFRSKFDISETFEERSSDIKLVKIEHVVAEIMQKNKMSQIIIFTNYDYIYTLLSPFLEKMNFSYKFLDGGNINTMDNIIGAYKRREFNILLADSSMYSCGMNLENTTDIIFVHGMEVQREKQVIGRAHRYGRENALNIWYIDYVE